jgi:protein phosphatase
VLLTIPNSALVLLIGPAGSGKSTFARRHFRPTEILSSDHYRAVLTDEEADQSATRDVFYLLRLITRNRLKRRKLTVIDATNLKARARSRLLAIAFQFNIPALAIVFQIDPQIRRKRNQERSDRIVPPTVMMEQEVDLEHSLPTLLNEGFTQIYILQSAQQVDSAVIERDLTPRDNSALPL